jgi:hypothetical protein
MNQQDMVTGGDEIGEEVVSKYSFDVVLKLRATYRTSSATGIYIIYRPNIIINS